MIGNKMNKETILITGINGFLGSNLAKQFKAEYNVVGLEINIDNLTRINEENYPVYEANDKGLEKLFSQQKIDRIIYAATLYGRNGENINQLLEANLLAPFNLLNIAIENKVPVFINTDTVLDRYTSPYALTKKQFSDWLKHRQQEIKVVNMPLEHFYGPECPDTNFISIMTKRLLANEPKIDLTLGEPLRNFVYFSDLLDAYKLVLNKLNDLTPGYHEFEVSTHELVSIKDIMFTLKTLTASSTELNFGAIPYRRNELMKSCVDNSALVALGWHPNIKIKEGLKLTVNGIQNTIHL